MEPVSLRTWNIVCHSRTRCRSAGTNTGWATKKTIPLDVPVVSPFPSPSCSFCIFLGLNYISCFPPVCHIYRYTVTCARVHARTHPPRLLWHSHAAWQIPPSAKKSINKCIVSSLSAVGISLSKLSEKAAECEIEFRTVRRVRWHKMSVCLLIYSYCSGVQTWFCKKGSVKHTEVLSVEIWQV